MNKEPRKDKSSDKWTTEQEELMAEWAEKAAGYRWLHSRSEKLYRKRNYTFTIPVIILSTLTGTANFAMDSFVPEENKQIAMACVGGVNIFAGILSTLQNFLRYAELMEGHRGSEVSWSKFNREISVELALNPTMRKPATDFLNVCRAEFDRLIEQSPTIDDSIIKQYKYTFKGVNINHPLVCNGLHKCKVYEPSEQEKTASIVANAGEKMKMKAFNHIRDNRRNNTNDRIINNPKEQKNENMKELDSLKGIGKVSGMKGKINPDKSYENPQEELKNLVIPEKSEDEKKDDNLKKDDKKDDNLKEDEKLNEKKKDDNLKEDENLKKDDNLKEKKNIKVSINVDDEHLDEGEYELFRGSLNKKDKKIDGDIYLVEKKPSKEVIEEVLDEIVIDIDTNENYSGETESVEESIEINKNVVDFLNDIK
jgi:hypothetical protein